MYLSRARVLKKIIAESSGSTIAENEFEITITEKHHSLAVCLCIHTFCAFSYGIPHGIP